MSKKDDSGVGEENLSRRGFLGAGLGAAAAATGLGHASTSTASSNSAPESPTGPPGHPRIAAEPYARPYPRGQGFNAITANYFEAPMDDPDYLEVWCYTDKLSYFPGETVEFHVSTTAKQFSMEIIRDGLKPKTVYETKGVAGRMSPLPDDFITAGCNWPALHRWQIPKRLPSGFYLVISRVENDLGEVREQEHGFFVKSPRRRKKADILLVAATCTWQAYNDWGGSNSYVAAKPAEGFKFAPVLTYQRPFSRGLLAIPEGAPRKPHEYKHGTGAVPRYPCIEFATAMGYTRWYPNAGWATYERPFVVWAEDKGYQLDYATQQDLESDPKLLAAYKCVVFVGHDEYWSWPMRDAVDRYVEGGGHVARFAGNFLWQVRMEDGGQTQVCYKLMADKADPHRLTPDKHLTTHAWEHPMVGRSGVETFGLNAIYGIYAGVGVNVPRGPGGFTVYRQHHWAFAGTDLYYGDTLGGDALIFGYEVDGLDYTFNDGLPYPTARNKAPESLEILAMGLASNLEDDHHIRGTVFYYGDEAARGLDPFRYGPNTSDETYAAATRGNGMVVTFNRGKGSVFHAGSCEWVAGLKRRDSATEQVTRNVLDRYTGRSRKS